VKGRHKDSQIDTSLRSADQQNVTYIKILNRRTIRGSWRSGDFSGACGPNGREGTQGVQKKKEKKKHGDRSSRWLSRNRMRARGRAGRSNFTVQLSGFAGKSVPPRRCSGLTPDGRSRTGAGALATTTRFGRGRLREIGDRPVCRCPPPREALTALHCDRGKPGTLSIKAPSHRGGRVHQWPFAEGSPPSFRRGAGSREANTASGKAVV